MTTFGKKTLWLLGMLLAQQLVMLTAAWAADPAVKPQKTFDQCPMNGRLTFKDGAKGCIENYPGMFNRDLASWYMHPLWDLATTRPNDSCPTAVAVRHIYNHQYNTVSTLSAAQSCDQLLKKTPDLSSECNCDSVFSIAKTLTRDQFERYATDFLPTGSGRITGFSTATTVADSALASPSNGTTPSSAAPSLTNLSRDSWQQLEAERAQTQIKLEEERRRQELAKAGEVRRQQEQQLKLAEERRKQEAEAKQTEERKRQELAMADEERRYQELQRKLAQERRQQAALVKQEEERKRQEIAKAEEERRQQELQQKLAEERRQRDVVAKLEEDRRRQELVKAEEERRQQEIQQRLAEERRQREILAKQEEERKRQEIAKAEEVRRQQEAAAKLAAEREAARVAAEGVRQKDLEVAALAAEVARLREQLLKTQAQPVVQVGNRKALVIGNDQYKAVPKLVNARSDAKLLADRLQSFGYSVTLKYDLTERDMKSTLRIFKAQVSPGDEVAIFFAGHGVQLGSANYLLPVDVAGESEDQIKDEAIPLQRILDDMTERKAKLTLTLVDACRDNPFKTAGRSIGSGARGLAPTSAATGQMVVYSAGTGQQALDKVGANDKTPNGLFMRVFAKEIDKSGVTIDAIVRTVRNEVARLARTVGHEQVPAIYDQVEGEFYLKR